jgi:DNA-binding CsgD family transcriptional regulator
MGLKLKPRGFQVAVNDLERQRIKWMKEQGLSNREIGRLLKRSPGTISKAANDVQIFGCKNTNWLI